MSLDCFVAFLGAFDSVVLGCRPQKEPCESYESQELETQALVIRSHQLQLTELQPQSQPHGKGQAKQRDSEDTGPPRVISLGSLMVRVFDVEVFERWNAFLLERVFGAGKSSHSAPGDSEGTPMNSRFLVQA